MVAPPASAIPEARLGRIGNVARPFAIRARRRPGRRRDSRGLETALYSVFPRLSSLRAGSFRDRDHFRWVGYGLPAPRNRTTFVFSFFFPPFPPRLETLASPSDPAQTSGEGYLAKGPKQVGSREPGRASDSFV